MGFVSKDFDTSNENKINNEINLILGDAVGELNRLSAAVRKDDRIDNNRVVTVLSGIVNTVQILNAIKSSTAKHKISFLDKDE